MRWCDDGRNKIFTPHERSVNSFQSSQVTTYEDFTWNWSLINFKMN